MTPVVWTAVGSIVTWTLVIVGWLFVSRDNNTRERRKELRSQIDTATKEIDAISSTGRDLLTSSGNEKSAQLKRELILSSLKVLGARTQVVNYSYPNFSVSKELILFRQAITGSATGFDDPGRPAVEEDDQRMIEIFRSAAFLKVSLELQYHALFKKK